MSLPEDAAILGRSRTLLLTTDPNHRRRSPRGVFVGEGFAAGRERGVMKSGTGAQLPALAVEVDLPDLLLQRIAFVRRVRNDLARGVDAVDVAHFEIALGELLLEFGVRGERNGGVVAIEIEVGVSVAPTGENHGPIAHSHVVVFVEELLVADLEDLARVAEFGTDEIQGAMPVIAAEGLDPQGVAIDPAKARDIVAGADGNVHPRGLAALGAHHAHAHLGVGVAGLGIALPLHLRVRGNPVVDRILRHDGFVHLEIGEIL